VDTQRVEVIFAGVGGMGALTAGQLFAQASLAHYRHVTWYPNITTARRNAPADCVVICAEEPIASPLIYQVDAVVIIEVTQLKAFQDRIKPGGLLLVETTGLQETIGRQDIKIMKIAGIETALALGNTRVANLVMLGAYIGSTNVLPAQLLEEALKERFGHNQKVLELNLKAFNEGIRLGQQAG